MTTSFKLHIEISHDAGPLEALSIFAEWCDQLGPEFRLYEYRKPGDIEFNREYQFAADTARLLLRSCGIHNGYFFPIGCREVLNERDHFAIDTSVHWMKYKPGKSNISFNLEIENNKCQNSFVNSNGTAGLIKHLSWLVDRVLVRYAFASPAGSIESDLYRVKVGSGWGVMTRKAVEDALGFVEWITFYCNEIIEKYGVELLMNAEWAEIFRKQSGCIFIATKKMPDWKCAADISKLSRILGQIKFYERFREQSVTNDSGRIGGVIVFYPSTSTTVYEPNELDE